jgi:hypothetical protein
MKRRLVFISLFLFLFSFLAACSTTKKGGTASSMEGSPRASYYDFDDIRIPSEMKLNKTDSFVYTSSRLKVGVLTFSGRVDPDSLAEFFQNNMPQDKWQPLSTLKYRGTMLVFLKGDRACVITIREGMFSTDLEVRVGPVEQASAGQVKGVTPR